MGQIGAAERKKVLIKLSRHGPFSFYFYGVFMANGLIIIIRNSCLIKSMKKISNQAQGL